MHPFISSHSTPPTSCPKVCQNGSAQLRCDSQQQVLAKLWQRNIGHSLEAQIDRFCFALKLLRLALPCFALPCLAAALSSLCVGKGSAQHLCTKKTEVDRKALLQPHREVVFFVVSSPAWFGDRTKLRGGPKPTSTCLQQSKICFAPHSRDTACIATAGYNAYSKKEQGSASCCSSKR